VLSPVPNLYKTLGKLGCSHFAGLKSRGDFEGPSELGETSGEISKPLRSFMKYFWLRFDRPDAHSLAEARHAAVSACLQSLLC
jgi:hypothetical protein